MIESLTLENFKAFKQQSISLKPLTLLTGLNGMGKSSAIQSLLLLRQSYQDGVLNQNDDSGLVLNGALVQLGTGRDVLFNNADSDDIGIKISTSDCGSSSWEFNYDLQADVLKHKKTAHASKIYQSSLFGQDFHYLQAERVGPRPMFDMADFVVREQRQLGVLGQYAAHFLSEYRDEEVLEQLHHPDSTSDTLIGQTMAWMSEISPGTQIKVDNYSEIDVVRLSFGFVRADTVGNVNYHRATNVGFGLTYTLPVLVAILSSKPGSLVLLENPEAHLHPRGQSQIGELMARAANAGIQIIVETHSDHILNGIRVAARNGMIEPSDVALHFFQRPQEDSELKGAEVISPKLDKDGRIDQWPEHFFDEFDKNLMNLL